MHRKFNNKKIIIFVIVCIVLFGSFSTVLAAEDVSAESGSDYTALEYGLTDDGPTLVGVIPGQSINGAFSVYYQWDGIPGFEYVNRTIRPWGIDTTFPPPLPLF